MSDQSRNLRPRVRHTLHPRTCVLNRCSMLWPDPAQRDRLAEIRDDLVARIAEAECEGWLGEVEVVHVKPRRRREETCPKLIEALAAPPSIWACQPLELVRDDVIIDGLRSSQ